MHLQRLAGFVAWAAAFLMLGIASLAFVVSFEAIKSFAAKSGAVSPGMAWAIPPLVDATIVMASLVLFSRSLAGERAAFAVSVLVAAALGSLSLNVAHAPQSLGAWSVALIAPAALVLSVELAMSELRRAIRKPSPEMSALVPEGGAEAAPGTDLGPLQAALTEASEDGQPSGAKFAAALVRHGVDISERDARRVLAVLRMPRERQGPDGSETVGPQDQDAPALVPAEQTSTS